MTRKRADAKPRRELKVRFSVATALFRAKYPGTAKSFRALVWKLFDGWSSGNPGFAIHTDEELLFNPRQAAFFCNFVRAENDWTPTHYPDHLILRSLVTARKRGERNPGTRATPRKPKKEEEE